MNNVLVIAPDFLPSTYPQALRVRFSTAWLRKFNWNPIILTVRPEEYSWLTDAESLERFPKDLEIIRTRAVPKKIASKIGFSDIGMRTLFHHYGTARKLCAARDIRMIYIPMPPHISMLLGKWLNQEYKIPYVLDYSDPWVTDYYWSLPKKDRPSKWRLVYKIAKIVEPAVLSRASGIVAVSQKMLDEVFRQYPKVKAPKVKAEIPLGFEPRDFDEDSGETLPSISTDEKLFNIRYIGAFIKPMLPALESVFAAVKEGLNMEPSIFGKIKFEFVGTNYLTSPGSQKSLIVELAEKYGLGERVTEQTSRVSYSNALRLMKTADMLMILGFNAAYYSASKLFPYMYSGKPLLVLFHEKSNMTALFKKSGSQGLVEFTDSGMNKTIVSQIRERLTAVQRPAATVSAGFSERMFLEEYESVNISKKMAGVFDAVLEREIA